MITDQLALNILNIFNIHIVSNKQTNIFHDVLIDIITIIIKHNKYIILFVFVLRYIDLIFPETIKLLYL